MVSTENLCSSNQESPNIKFLFQKSKTSISSNHSFDWGKDTKVEASDGTTNTMSCPKNVKELVIM